MTDIELRPDERIDEIAASGIQIIQSREVFSFSIDAILLARFPQLPGRKGKIVDLCAGNGAVGLFAASKTKAHITSVEIQDRLAEMAERSVSLNGLDEQFTIINDDLKNTLKHLNHSSTDLIFCNPPYFKVDEESHINENEHYTLARHELTTNLNEIFELGKRLLKTNGHFALVHRPERFFEIIDTMRAHNLQPKWIQFVYPKADQPANILLIDAIKDGKEGGEVFLPPLIIHESDGSYTKDVDEIYYGEH